MKKTIATLGSALLLSTASLAGAATPAAASEADLCSNPTFTTACEIVRRNAQHVQEELGQVPGYIAEAQQKVLEVYDFATYTVRCIISGTCL